MRWGLPACLECITATFLGAAETEDTGLARSVTMDKHLYEVMFRAENKNKKGELFQGLRSPPCCMQLAASARPSDHNSRQQCHHKSQLTICFPSNATSNSTLRRYIKKPSLYSPTAPAPSNTLDLGFFPHIFGIVKHLPDQSASSLLIVWQRRQPPFLTPATRKTPERRGLP